MARVCIYLPEEQLELVDSIAKLQRCSRSGLIREICAEFLHIACVDIHKKKYAFLPTYKYL